MRPKSAVSSLILVLLLAGTAAGQAVPLDLADTRPGPVTVTEANDVAANGAFVNPTWRRAEASTLSG